MSDINFEKYAADEENRKFKDLGKAMGVGAASGALGGFFRGMSERRALVDELIRKGIEERTIAYPAVVDNFFGGINVMDKILGNRDYYNFDILNKGVVSPEYWDEVGRNGLMQVIQASPKPELMKKTITNMLKSRPLKEKIIEALKTYGRPMGLLAGAAAASTFLSTIGKDVLNDALKNLANRDKETSKENMMKAAALFAVMVADEFEKTAGLDTDISTLIDKYSK